MPKKLTYKEVYNAFKSSGYTLLSDEYKNNRTKLKVKCPKGHEYEVKYNVFQQGKRCPICYGNKPLSLDYVKLYLKKYNYTCVDGEYKNTKTKMSFKCDKGHVYEQTFNDFQQGARCPFCYNKNRSETLTTPKDNVVKLFSQEGYTLLGEYIDMSTKVETMCPEGHIYNVTPSSFKFGSRCAECFYNIRGKEHPAYNHNITDEEREHRRDTSEYFKFLKSAYEKDDYTCQKCGYRKGHIHAHHINAYNWSDELRLDLDNVVVFCEPCHREYHRIYGHGANAHIGTLIDFGVEITETRALKLYNNLYKHFDVVLKDDVYKT